MYVSWIFLPSAPLPAPHVNITYSFIERRFTIEWMEASGSQMVDGFIWNITPDLDCTNSSMTVNCSYNEANLGHTYIFTVAALNCGGTQKGSEYSLPIHLRGMSLTLADYANT